MQYCPRPSAKGNSTSYHPRGSSFDYSPNSHRITISPAMGAVVTNDWCRTPKGVVPLHLLPMLSTLI